MNPRSVTMLVLILVVTRVFGAENSNDTYLYRDYCPTGQSVNRENQTATFPGGAVSGGWFNYISSTTTISWKDSSYFVDKWGFAQCNCTSYVAHALNELWSQSPSFNNGYYNLRDANNQVLNWGDARKWRDRAIQAGIGVTGARDNFTWDMVSYNAVFPGDVAWWDSWDYTDAQGVRRRNPYGHVAIVEGATQDVAGSGVRCVTLREYNWNPAVNFNRRTVCKSTDGHSFPNAFLHIDQDHTYCLQHQDQCPGFLSGTGGIGGRGGGGIGGGTDLFNLKLNRFWTRDIATGLDTDSDTGTVRTGQAISVRMQIKALNGDTHDHMRDGKDTIELDFYAREDLGEWYFLKREYIQATNLPNDATHTEHVDYVVPVGVSEVSFKVKVDAEDEAIEANEGDNWSRIITREVNNNPVYNLTVPTAFLTTTQPVPAGGLMGAKASVRNIGNATPPMAGKACYDINGPGTGGTWQTLEDDTLDGGTLVPGVDQWEEIISLVRAPTVPGSYTLRVTANCTGTIPEADYNDNSFSVPFQVVAPQPNFVITAVGPAGGKASFKKGSKINPAMYIKNVGNANPSSGIQSSYFYSGPETGNTWRYITGDNTSASELCVGCSMREQYDGGMKINTRGMYYFMGCADVNNAVAESREDDNCTVGTPITIY